MGTRSAVQQLACPSCGSPIFLQNPQSQMAVCNTCGTHVKIGMAGAELLARANKLHPAPKPVFVGKAGKFKDIDCLVMGRISYRGWDPSDASDVWYWDEWLLGGKDGRMFWLSYYKEDGFILWHKLRVKEQFDSFSAKQIPLGNGNYTLVKERYPAAVVGAEGELTKQVQPNEKLYMVEAAAAGKRHSIQVTQAELELYEGVPLDESEVALAFNNEQWAKTAKRAVANRGLFSTIAMAFIIFACVGGVLGAVLWNSGQEVYKEKITLTTDPASASHSFTVNVDQANRPVQIILEAENMPVNSFAEVEVIIIDPEGNEELLFAYEFWHETGTDADGSWTENDYNTSRRFIPKQEGEYEVEIELVEVSTNLTTLTMETKVRKNHIVSSWFVGYGIIIGVLGVIFLGMSAPESTGNFIASLMDSDD